VEEATANFKKLAHIYKILSDNEKRAFYDRFGEGSEALEGLEEASAIYEAVMQYVNSIPRVQKADICSFEKMQEQLREKGEVDNFEKTMLEEYYEKFKGDSKKILRHCNIHAAGFIKELDTSRYTTFLESLSKENSKEEKRTSPDSKVKTSIAKKPRKTN